MIAGCRRRGDTLVTQVGRRGEREKYWSKGLRRTRGRISVKFKKRGVLVQMGKNRLLRADLHQKKIQG